MSVNDAPNSNTVNVVIAKQAPLIVGGEMHFFFTGKVKSLGGDPAKLVRLVRFGATTPVGKVVVAGVPGLSHQRIASRFRREGPGQAPRGERPHRLCRAAGRVRPALQQRPGRVSLRRYRYHGGAGACRAQASWRQPRGDERRRRAEHDRPERGRFRRERAGAAELGDRHARQRGGNSERQGGAEQQDRRLSEGSQDAGTCAAQRQDHGVRR